MTSPGAAAPFDPFARVVELRASRGRAVLVTVIACQGSTPRKPGARMVIHADGSTEGTIGGGAIEQLARQHAPAVLASETTRVVEAQLTSQLAMCCGGTMTLFLEPVVRPPYLIVFGCGHVGTAIIQTAAGLGFEIIAVDDLVENANPQRLPQAGRIINAYERDELRELPFGEETYVVIATREHALDQRLLELCLPETTAYLGVIGSRRKAHMQRERLAAKAFAPDAIARVHCPVGLDIGAQSPEEIAVAVCAELIATRRGGAKLAQGT